MNYENMYKDFSPLKFQINNDYIDKLQKEQPLIMSFDNNAFNNLSKYLNNNIEKMQHKAEAIYLKSFLIDEIEFNTLKVFLCTFIILYLIAPKVDMLRVKDDINSKIYRPNMVRITLITFIVSLFFLAYQGIDLLSQFKEILFA